MNGNEQRGPSTEKEKIGTRSSVLGTPSFEVHIEELVLHGFAPGDRHSIGEAVEHELTRLFAEQDVPSSLAHGGEIARLDSETFEVAPNSNAEAIGAQIARAIYSGLNR